MVKKKLTKGETKITKTAIRAALRSLGKTSAEVAASLGRRHIKGERRNYLTCPMAVYLTKKFNRQARVSSLVRIDDPPLTINYPKAIRDFISDFDEGLYPRLVYN